MTARSYLPGHTHRRRLGGREGEWLSPCTALITTHEENCPLFYILQNLTEIHTVREINRVEKESKIKRKIHIARDLKGWGESRIERKTH